MCMHRENIFQFIDYTDMTWLKFNHPHLEFFQIFWWHDQKWRERSENSELKEIRLKVLCSSVNPTKINSMMSVFISYSLAIMFRKILTKSTFSRWPLRKITHERFFQTIITSNFTMNMTDSHWQKIWRIPNFEWYDLWHMICMNGSCMRGYLVNWRGLFSLVRV